MGIGNFLIEGVSGTGKTSVCTELLRRGYHAVHGDRELAYQGDPTTGKPDAGSAHENHLWQVDKVEALVADQGEAMTFFCGGSRNFHAFLHLFNGVFVLEVDPDTLRRRLESRPDDEWGGREEQRQFIVSLHQSKEDVPHDGVLIDATAPVSRGHSPTGPKSSPHGQTSSPADSRRSASAEFVPIMITGVSLSTRERPSLPAKGKGKVGVSPRSVETSPSRG